LYVLILDLHFDERMWGSGSIVEKSTVWSPLSTWSRWRSGEKYAREWRSDRCEVHRQGAGKGISEYCKETGTFSSIFVSQTLREPPSAVFA
jgi:hypothetical protein